MLLEYIEKKRQEPEEVRMRFAVAFSIAFTGVVVMVWLSVKMMGGVLDTSNEEDRLTFDEISVSQEAFVEGGFWDISTSFFEKQWSAFSGARGGESENVEVPVE
jgi:hypothetical protein